ncbi:hypothetical protein D3C72_2046070 [compost metagenome]
MLGGRIPKIGGQDVVQVCGPRLGLLLPNIARRFQEEKRIILIVAFSFSDSHEDA